MKTVKWLPGAFRCPSGSPACAAGARKHPRCVRAAGDEAFQRWRSADRAAAVHACREPAVRAALGSFAAQVRERCRPGPAGRQGGKFPLWLLYVHLLDLLISNALPPGCLGNTLNISTVHHRQRVVVVVAVVVGGEVKPHDGANVQTKILVDGAAVFVCTLLLLLLFCSTCVCEMTTLRSRIHTESTCGSAVSILANLFVYRCHFGISFESLRNFVSPTLLSLVISQIFLCFQSARVPTGKQPVLPEMTNHTPVRSDELRIDFERRSIDTQTYATVVEAGGKRVCVRQGFMALCVRSSLSFLFLFLCLFLFLFLLLLLLLLLSCCLYCYRYY